MIKLSKPLIIYRAFDQRCYADDFVKKGIIRLGNLKHYRTIEDTTRQDETEGFASYKFLDSTLYAHNGNPIYILSCSTSEVDLYFLQRKMGSYVVQINDIEQLKHDILEGIKAMQLKPLGDLIRSDKVSYDKYQPREQKLSSTENHELAMFQKPPCFKNECEYRIASIFDYRIPQVLLSSHIVISLNKRLDYARLLPC